MTTHVSHNNFCVLYVALGTIDTIFSPLPLKEPFFYDSSDSLLFVHKSPISIFIFLSLLSVCISQCSVNIFTWYVYTLKTSLVLKVLLFFSHHCTTRKVSFTFTYLLFNHNQTISKLFVCFFQLITKFFNSPTFLQSQEGQMITYFVWSKGTTQVLSCSIV